MPSPVVDAQVDALARALRRPGTRAQLRVRSGLSEYQLKRALRCLGYAVRREVVPLRSGQRGRPLLRYRVGP